MPQLSMGIFTKYVKGIGYFALEKKPIIHMYKRNMLTSPTILYQRTQKRMMPSL